MLAITRGPSMKPAWAATKRSSASETSVTHTNQWPSGQAGQVEVAGEALRPAPRSSSCPVDRRDVEQQVAEDDAAGGERQRGGHQHHGALAGLHLGLAHDLQPVVDRLDAGVGAARPSSRRAGRARAGPPAPAWPARWRARRGPARSTTRAARRRESASAPPMRMAWVTRKATKMGARMVTDSLTPRRLRMTRTPMASELHRQLPAVQRRRHEAEDGVRPAGDRDGDGQHVVDHQRAAGDDARRSARAAGWPRRSRRRRTGSAR